MEPARPTIEDQAWPLESPYPGGFRARLFAIAAASALLLLSPLAGTDIDGLAAAVPEPPSEQAPAEQAADEKASIEEAAAEEPPPVPSFEVDLVWDAQEEVIARTFARLPAQVANATDVYALMIAPDGRQGIFSRETHAALRLFASRHGDEARGGLLLSNAWPDLMDAPLATRSNIFRVAKRIGEAMEPSRDILLLYLASHGSPDATLVSALPDFSPIEPIGAEWLAGALDAAGIHRRIIIVSACFAGSWIPYLTNDDTIVIAAAAEDRSSFGCSDDHRLTFFGEAFLEGKLAGNASLAEAFAGARKTIARWEKEQHIPPSRPLAYVGRNMRKVWQTRGSDPVR